MEANPIPVNTPCLLFPIPNVMIITLIVAWIVFIILWKLIKTTIKTALICAAIVMLLYFGFHITPQDIWHQISQFVQTFSQTPAKK